LVPIDSLVRSFFAEYTIALPKAIPGNSWTGEFLKSHPAWVYPTPSNQQPHFWIKELSCALL
jgi:hypothetical protein